MNKKNVRVVSLIVTTFTYLLVGASIFDILEGDYEMEHLHEQRLIQLNLTTKYNMSEDDYNELKSVVIALIPHNAVQWKFAGSFYYAIIVMTAIGYGHSVPRTPGGRMFTVFYSLVGIPLGLIVFQSIGERLNVFATFLLANCKKLFRFKNPEVSSTNLIIVVTFLALSVVFVGASVFNHYENWGFLNCIYYCIITLTTIGFGDYVPLQNSSTALEQRPEYVAFTLMFIIVGLTVLSMNMNLCVLRFMTANQEEFLEEEAQQMVLKEKARSETLMKQLEENQALLDRMHENDTTENEGDKSTTKVTISESSTSAGSSSETKTNSIDSGRTSSDASSESHSSNTQSRSLAVDYKTKRKNKTSIV